MNTLVAPAPARPGAPAVWAARIVSTLVVLFLAFDMAMKLLQVPMALKATEELGYAPSIVVWLGVVQLFALVLYLLPSTAPLGALVWTGYLGGAIATHARLDHPLFSHTLFPIYVAVMLWLPLYLRDPRVRALVPRLTSAEP